MIYATWFKVSNELLEDDSFKPYIKDWAKKGLPRKGFKSFFLSQHIMNNAPMNLSTVITRYKLYKKPRFIK